MSDKAGHLNAEIIVVVTVYSVRYRLPLPSYLRGFRSLSRKWQRTLTRFDYDFQSDGKALPHSLTIQTRHMLVLPYIKARQSLQRRISVICHGNTGSVTETGIGALKPAHKDMSLSTTETRTGSVRLSGRCRQVTVSVSAVQDGI